MSSMFGAGFLLALPVLIAQWIGVIALVKSGRNGAWWSMAVGTSLSTLGSILSMLGIIFMVVNPDKIGGSMSVGYSLLAVGAVSGLGSLVFVVGFAMHGLRSKRMEHRVEELETLIAVQGEQLNRQNPSDPS